MTSATVTQVLSIPTPREIWSHVKMDPAVTKVAIICATVLGIVLTAGVVVVAVLGGDLAALSLAIGGIFTAAITAWTRIQGKKVDNGGGTS